MQGKKDERVLITDEVLQRQILLLIMLIIAVLEAWESLVQWVIVLEVSIGTVFPCARVDVGIVVAVRADNQGTSTT